MGDPDELALVEKAIKSGLDGCVEWDHRVIDRIRDEMAIHRFTPERIKEAIIEFVQAGGAIRQVKEQKHGWKDKRDYYYKIILPTPGFKKGLFVEIELSCSDTDYPEIKMVNAHEQK